MVNTIEQIRKEYEDARIGFGYNKFQENAVIYVGILLEEIDKLKNK